MATATPPTTPPDAETDNWDSTSIEAPRQKAGDVIERQSFEADDRGGHKPPAEDAERQADEAEATARRQTPTDDGSAGSA